MTRAKKLSQISLRKRRSRIAMKKKAKDLKLQIELVPKGVWFSSIYQLYKKSNRLSEWRKIKSQIFEKEGHCCWICGKEKGRLEAHEFWMYNDRNHVQKLTAIHHLCGMCHKIKHIGLWCYTPYGNEQMEQSGLTKDDLSAHFCKVNNVSVEEFEKHEDEALRIWKKRSKYKWKQDFGEYNPNFRKKDKMKSISGRLSDIPETLFVISKGRFKRSRKNG